MFNCALSYSGDLIVIGTTKSLAEGFKDPFKIIPNVCSVAVGSKDIVFVQIDGSVGMVQASDPTEIKLI